MNRQIDVELPHAAFIYRKTRRSVFPLNRVLFVAQRVSAFMNSKPVGEVLIDVDSIRVDVITRSKARSINRAIRAGLFVNQTDRSWLDEFNEALYQKIGNSK